MATTGQQKISIKGIVDEALEKAPVETVIVYKRTGQDTQMLAGRDYWWHEALEGQSAVNQAAEMDSEDMLFILYTSGSTGKPKGVVHTTGGYMVYTKYSFENVFQYTPGDVYWCTADIGWITGHSYIVYGPLLAGATTLMFEGVPTYPHPGRFWEIIEKYKVNVFILPQQQSEHFKHLVLNPFKDTTSAPSKSSALSANPSTRKLGTGTTTISARESARL